MTAFGKLCPFCAKENYQIKQNWTTDMTKKQKIVMSALRVSELQTATQIIRKIDHQMSYRGLRTVLSNLVKLGHAEHSDCLGPDTWCIPE